MANKKQTQEMKIRCGKCGNEEFTLRYFIVDGVKSIVANCKCGRTIEYRGIEQAIDLVPGMEAEQSASKEVA